MVHGRGLQGIHWQFSMCGRGACKLGGMHGRRCAWQGGVHSRGIMHGGRHVWQRVCMADPGVLWQPNRACVGGGMHCMGVMHGKRSVHGRGQVGGGGMRGRYYEIWNPLV